jgi:hypothetical protein
MTLVRREFLKVAAAAGAAAVSATAATNTNAATSAGNDSNSEALRNATMLGDRMVAWQSPYGATDLEKCPHRSPTGTPTIAVVQGIGPQVRALYQLYEATGAEKYKHAADRYAVFVISTIHDPPTPLTNKIVIDGMSLHTNSSAWVYGKSLSPCYEWFVANNPHEDLLNLKAHSIYRWLQRHRRDDSYFGVGYTNGDYEDAQFSCDLGEVGTGLVGFYKTSKHEPALQDALGLSKYFLTEHQQGSAKGVWSSDVGTWLVGPWPGGGAEHFTMQQYDQTGWGWSCLVVGEFLLELRPYVQDDVVRQSIDDKCVKAFCWCIDNCQFEDGAHGMFGRDDKWVGQTAAAILLYGKLVDAKLIPESIEATYRPKVERSWQWLLSHTGPETYPADGYIKVNGSTTTKPPENLMWMMSWTIEALLSGQRLFAVPT